jgi:hypothetical protein
VAPRAVADRAAVEVPGPPDDAGETWPDLRINGPGFSLNEPKVARFESCQGSQMSSRVLTRRFTLNRAEKSNVGTNRSKGNASGRERRCRWKMRGVWWVEGYVEHYCNVRLNSAGYITPKDMLTGRQQDIHTERDRKLEAARKQRQIRRQSAA